MTATLVSMARWEGDRSRVGARTFKVVWRVETDSDDDGPQVVMNCPGLPAPGSIWDFGNDYDDWAFCMPTLRARPLVTDEINNEWEVEQEFSTFDPGEAGGWKEQRCQTVPIENPLLEPVRISGSFLKYARRATRDKDDKLILNHDLTPMKGPEMDFDTGHWSVRIGWNQVSLPSATFAPLVNRVNDATLWGMAARCVRLTGVTFTKAYYGICTAYYSIDYDFEINGDTFDKYVQPFCYKKLKPGGTVTNPDHYIAITDEPGNLVGMILKSDGTVWDGTGTEPTKLVKHYKEANLLTLGIPSSL